MVLAAHARAAGDEDHVRAGRGAAPREWLAGSSPSRSVRFEHAAVARDEAAQHVRIRVVDLIAALRRRRAPRTSLPVTRMRTRGRRHRRRRAPCPSDATSADVLRAQAPARAQHRRRPSRCPRRDAPTCWPGATGRVISICPPIRDAYSAGTTASTPCGHRRAGHDADRRSPARRAPPNGCPGIDLADDGKRERVVLARAGGVVAAQRVAVHRRAIESRHVDRSRRRPTRARGPSRRRSAPTRRPVGSRCRRSMQGPRGPRCAGGIPACERPRRWTSPLLSSCHPGDAPSRFWGHCSGRPPAGSSRRVVIFSGILRNFTTGDGFKAWSESDSSPRACSPRRRTARRRPTCSVFAAASLKDALDAQVAAFKAAAPATRSWSRTARATRSRGRSRRARPRTSSSPPISTGWTTSSRRGSWRRARASNLLRNTLVLIAPAVEQVDAQDRPRLRPRRGAGHRKSSPWPIPTACPPASTARPRSRRWACGRASRSRSRARRTCAPRSRSCRAGEAPFGIVYCDRRAAPTRACASSIRFPPAAIRRSSIPPRSLPTSKSLAAKPFLDYLRSAPARPVWEKHGFVGCPLARMFALTPDEVRDPRAEPARRCRSASS